MRCRVRHSTNLTEAGPGCMLTLPRRLLPDDEQSPDRNSRLAAPQSSIGHNCLNSDSTHCPCPLQKMLQLPYMLRTTGARKGKRILLSTCSRGIRFAAGADVSGTSGMSVCNHEGPIHKCSADPSPYHSSGSTSTPMSPSVSSTVICLSPIIAVVYGFLQ